MKKVSVIIPTVLKCPKVLAACVEAFHRDEAVGEIIIIKNTQEDLPSDFPFLGKVQVILCAENLYVNKSWNFGRLISQFDIIALVNDDLIPEENQISRILEKGWLDDAQTGLLGIDIFATIGIDKENFHPNANFAPQNLERKELPLTDGIGDWGSFIIGRRECFYDIPEDLKILWGDHYLIRKNMMNGRTNYIIKNLRCQHIHSCSCMSPEFHEINGLDHDLWHKTISKEFNSLMSRFSVIIPTLLIREDILRILVNTISDEEIVNEIIIINNNTEKQISFDNPKVTVLNQETNLYVNKSWNLGVSLAKNSLFALLNDDIIVGKNFFKTLSESVWLQDTQVGLVGMGNYINFENGEDDLSLPEKSNDTVFCAEADIKQLGDWGICIVGKKDDYYTIPEELNILFGDNYIIEKNTQAGKNIISIFDLPIKHIHSLSTRGSDYADIIINDFAIWDNNKEALLAR